MREKTKLVQFRVSEREFEMLEALCDRYGAKASEYLRGIVREKFSKAFPVYTKAGQQRIAMLEPELTPEQLCEAKGGKVEVIDGVPMCVIQLSSAMTRKVPLSSPHLLK